MTATRIPDPTPPATARSIPRPAEAMIRYARHADVAYPDHRPEPPPLLEVPLAERLRRVDAGEWDDDEWTAQTEAWTAAADPRYRALVARRRPDPHTPTIRVGVKDTVDVAGFPTGLGLRHYRHHPKASAPALAPVERAGDLVIAKVVSTELNIGIGSGCLNPYFPHIDPAGSSTGSGVAVAANLCDLSMGTDVLGSVRWPAGQCGTVGLRMTHDSRSLGGIFPLSPAMDAVGWVARTADDLALLWRRLGLGALVEPTGAGIGERYRIGVVDNVRDGSCDPEMLGAVDQVCDWLSDDGHLVDPVRLDDLWRSRGDAWQLCARQAWDGYRHCRQWITVPLHESTERALRIGARVDDRHCAAILADLEETRREVPARFGDHCHAWVLPLDPSTPPDLRVRGPMASTIPAPGDPDYDRAIGYTPIASFAGLPAIAVPVRLSTVNGAPLGVQLVGPPGGEERLIDLARRVQRHSGDLGLRPR
ncbi:amidase [Saccharothrix violaceirubra]|uniref:Asp-tRNA(Asn)/Glu-tRNA(Gln) amidotransferase A subunit family amidase n=1 Tax=Saccharothrix violaceirubra TaxID=413306 RepID=A0A7W7T2V5_9PSEU|nr:amidase [Saccharothrix violaceirubra]MBB4965590.1 Asp-tRNA(Asn)/Glu-tRNA(Gln) amidotransferase A subunit family amidase [Saccharothrix violaceirubra]